MGLPADFSPPERAGPYRLAEPLGRGGYGVVFRGVDDAGREAALKLHPRGGRALSRFRQEYLLLSWLDHPAIPRALAFGEAPGGVAWLAMERAVGAPVSAAARRQGPPGAPARTARALTLVASLLRALEYLHAQGVIHGDLKPSNVLAGPGGAVRLLDFGAAQIVRPGERYAPQPFVGTRHHAPLEQLMGRPLDARSDLFAAGVIAYQLLTDERPYRGETLEACLRERVEQVPPAPAERVPGLPADLSALVQELLSASPADRPPSAAAALARLGAAPPPWLARAGVPAALQHALAERVPAPTAWLAEPGPLRDDLTRLGIPLVEGSFRGGDGLEGLGEAVQHLAAGLAADPPGVDRAWLAGLDMGTAPAEPRRLLHAVTAVALAAQPTALLLDGPPGPLAAEALRLLEQWSHHYRALVWILRLEAPPTLDAAQQATLREAEAASEKALAEGRISAAIQALAPAEALALPPEERARLRLRRAEAARWLHQLGEVRRACERPPEAERARAARLGAWLALELGRPGEALPALEAVRAAGDPLTDAWHGAVLAAIGLPGQQRVAAAMALLEGEARSEAQLLLACASGTDPAALADPSPPLPASPLLQLSWRRASLDHARRSGDAARTRVALAAATALADAIAAQLDPSDAPAWALHREILGV